MNFYRKSCCGRHDLFLDYFKETLLLYKSTIFKIYTHKLNNNNVIMEALNYPKHLFYIHQVGLYFNIEQKRAQH